MDLDFKFLNQNSKKTFLQPIFLILSFWPNLPWLPIPFSFDFIPQLACFTQTRPSSQQPCPTQLHLHTKLAWAAAAVCRASPARHEDEPLRRLSISPHQTSTQTR
jgi:hypothetical protein